MLKLMDCTLRDGGNVVGKGFNTELTSMILEGLTNAKVDYIEFGNAGGIGAYEVAGFTKAEADENYLKLAQPYLAKSHLGMFLNAKRYQEKYVQLAADSNLSFLRVGVDADESDLAIEPIKAIKNSGMKAFYSAMKAYLLDPTAIAETARKLEAVGLDVFTIMDSAGCMLPEDVAKMTEAIVKSVKIPVAFHCHNNLALSAANALAAYRSGATILDCGLMGMARSAGNLPTEAAIALMQKYGELKHVDLYEILEFIDKKLEPTMREKYNYSDSILPLDLVLGISGAHSSFNKLFKQVAGETGVNLFKLIIETSAINRKKPTEDLMRSVAAKISKK